MKGVKDEEKPLDHMFPRLHINDTDKRGPKAPPRNKMSLYEKLSVPSQRLTSGSSITLPLPRIDRGNIVPPTSAASRGSDVGKCLDANISTSAACSRPTERLHPYYSGGTIMSIVPKNAEFPTTVLPKYHAPTAAGYFSMLTNTSFPQAHPMSSSQKKPVEEVSIRVPSFCRGVPSIEKEKLSKSSSHWQLQTPPVGQLKQTSKTDISSTKVVRGPIEGHTNRPAGPVLANRDKLFLDASLSVGTRNKVPESGKKEKSSVVDSGRLPESNAQLCHEFKPFQDKTVQIDSTSEEPNSSAGKRKRFTLEPVLCSRPSPDDCQRSSIKIESSDQCELLQVDKNNDKSETSIVDSISGGDINPDNVIGVIGRQQFWRIRRALLHQQRTFALQLFELHRITQVQRLIAASPQVLLGTNAGKPLKQMLPVDKLLPENVPEAPDFTTLLTLQKPLPSLNNDKKSEPKTHKSNFIPYLSNPPPPATSADKKSPLCFLPAPGNQWLVPVMSPSEGLIYKPYTGPCPPASSSSSSMANPTPTNPTNPPGTDIPSRSYSITASNQQGIGIFLGTPFGHTYVSPYGMPLMNLSNAKDNHLTLDVNFSKPSHSSLNMSSAMNTSCVGNSSALRESERRASAETSPDRKEGDVALPLFPNTPTAKNTENHSKVIKVVPHNARATPESAARIFESIKEGRR